jgi:L-fuconolactonase
MIDAHHHLWKYSPAEYGWITPQMPAIRRDFLPAQLEELMHHFGIEGTVAVQARQTLEETSWLLSLAEKHPLIRGVVGWVPLTEGAGVKRHLERFAGNHGLRGVRHVIHDEADPRYILRDDFNAGVRALREFGLRYDILIFERHLPAAIEFVDRHPNQVFILDHVAKPRIKERIISPWDRNMRELAKRQNVYCKLSGMATEADLERWTPEDLQPYIDVALAAFGPRRLMYGSDWPVLLLAGDYARWFGTVSNAISKLSKAEQERIMGGTAAEAYGITQ